MTISMKKSVRVRLEIAARHAWANAPWCWYSPRACAQYVARDTGLYCGWTAEQITNEIVRLGL